MISLTLTGSVKIAGRFFSTYDIAGMDAGEDAAGVAHALDVLMAATPMGSFGMDVFVDGHLGVVVNHWAEKRLVDVILLINFALA